MIDSMNKIRYRKDDSEGLLDKITGRVSADDT
jgi:hypothetical protein